VNRIMKEKCNCKKRESGGTWPGLVCIAVGNSSCVGVLYIYICIYICIYIYIYIYIYEGYLEITDTKHVGGEGKSPL
jgi:hypothetical protein